MTKFHIIYTTSKNKIRCVWKSFHTFKDAEHWLIKIKAKYWEIGV